jgi:hypothetical protein
MQFVCEYGLRNVCVDFKFLVEGWWGEVVGNRYCFFCFLKELIVFVNFLLYCMRGVVYGEIDVLKVMIGIGKFGGKEWCGELE